MHKLLSLLFVLPVAALECSDSSAEQSPAPFEERLLQVPVEGARVSDEVSPATARPEFDHEHSSWTRILARRVRGGGFDYAGLAKDRAGLDEYLETLESVRPEDFAGWSREQRYAFWINAYNAYTVLLVAEHYPVKSIKDIGSILKSVWDRRFVPLGNLHASGDNEKLSLNDIEHAILRRQFRDARVHAAVNCASESCPPLRNEAFVADNLGEQLDEQVRRWIADPGRNRFDEAARTVYASEIFSWFAEDFERDTGSAVAWIARFAPAEHRDWVRNAKLKFLDYSWKLNGSTEPGSTEPGLSPHTSAETP